MYQYTNKHNRSVAKNSSVKHTPSPKTIPNSAMLAGISTGDTSDFDLDGAMMQKMNALMNQIPAAEQEADRLSRGVHSTSFEGIREEMGQRLGADLSEIRLHTDAAAAEQADQIGAAAYTTGKDIYWGSGGFKPETMAHELVHTVQQGAVAGETSAAVPIGTVQMKPKLSLGYNSSYEVDKNYTALYRLMNRYNSEKDRIKKKWIEQELMSLAANYVSEYSTRETPEYTERAANAENLIYQLSATKEMRKQAQKKLRKIRKSISGKFDKTTKDRMHQTVNETENGIKNGEIWGKHLSPALRAILTETMAGQSVNTMLGTIVGPGQYTGAANAVGVTDARPPIISLDFKTYSLDKLVPGFFHEATHGYADQVYGSIVTMPKKDIPWEGRVWREETERTNTAAELSALGMGIVNSENKKSDQLIASLNKIEYATKADSNGDGYYDRAMLGFGKSRQDPTALNNLKTTRENLEPRAFQEKLEKAGAQHKYDAALKEARTEAEQAAAHAKYNIKIKEALSDYKSRFATMIEYDPSINEALMYFELSPDGNRDSPFYLALKAAALRSHVKRHNANVMNQIMDME